MKKILILFLAIGFYSNAQLNDQLFYNYNQDYNNNIHYMSTMQDQLYIISTNPIYNYDYNLLYTYPNNSTTIIYRRTNRCNW